MPLLGSYLQRTREIAKGVAHELRGGYWLTADPQSFARFAADVFLSRLARRVPLPGQNRDRMIRVKGGIKLHYRLNRGDMQSIREVWIDECYRLPFDLVPVRLVDLGANIGLASVWLARRYGCNSIIAIEPSPDNARLTRLNLEENQIAAEVIEAAVGARDGSAQFEDAGDSNLGRLNSSGGGREVAVVSMETVLKRFPLGANVDLLKMDIEGGEGPLFADNLGWLARVRSIVAEFHPTVIDYPAVVKTIQAQGFRYIPAKAAADFDSMDAFIRES